MTLHENQAKNIQKNDYEKPAAAPRKNVVDAAMQTNVIERSVGSCQTESSERKDFQVQVHLQQQSEPIATQTDSTAQCDFQVQATIPLASDSIAVQTIKEEIRMPNIPSSVSQTPAKKRKLSSKTTSGHFDYTDATLTANVASIDVPSPVQPITNEQINTEPIDDSSARRDSPPSQPTSNGSGNELINEQAHIDPSVEDSHPSQSISNRSGDQDSADDSISNSEVYKTYCREQDPEEAMKKIKELKGFISFEKSWSEPNEKELDRMSKYTLNKLWKQKPRCESKFDKVKRFVDDRIYGLMGAFYDNKTMGGILYRLTKIEMLIPNGYEYWYVADFDKGPGSSKWYRGASCYSSTAQKLAQLNVMGITNSILDQLQYNHYLSNHSREIKWLDFAEEFTWTSKAEHLISGCYIEKGMFRLKSKYKVYKNFRSG